ncbi:MAG: GNAT family N-acetyltransferase [Chloroflexi bacterium]|nr:MAG: GNAT family N-acetyltransferase [Chloroflexota bacterium]
MTNANPFDEKLENGLLFRTVRDEKDVVRYVNFNTEYNNPNEGLNTNCLIRHFPGASYADYQLIEDEQSDEIVSTTCLIPWTFDYEGIPIKAGQLEQVLSRPDYRRHGLVKLQIRRFMQVVRERGLDVTFIWGIPYYYRQYGYTYCLDGDTFELLPASRIPATVQNSAYTLRPATLADIPVLTELYQNAMRPLQFSVLRSPEHWRYLL